MTSPTRGLPLDGVRTSNPNQGHLTSKNWTRHFSCLRATTLKHTGEGSLNNRLGTVSLLHPLTCLHSVSTPACGRVHWAAQRRADHTCGVQTGNCTQNQTGVYITARIAVKYLQMLDSHSSFSKGWGKCVHD